MTSKTSRARAGHRCTECGWTTVKWVGRCGECQQWGTVLNIDTSAGFAQTITPETISDDRIARPITAIQGEKNDRWRTGNREFDRVLGGGIVPGAVILLSGEPGVGKSTLLLDVAARVAETQRRVLYASAEESVSQVHVRAQRTGALHSDLFLTAETDLAAIIGQINAVEPELVIVDSVQAVSISSREGFAGGPSQVRSVASALTRVAKDRGIPVLIVGHVTKDGTIAGPRVLEHLVDVVCHFDGDRQTALRFVRSQKNRFGPTDEVGCFEMTHDGIAEVPDPSGLFLSRTERPVSGTCVTVTMEGKRALPVEVQALIVPSHAPQVRRVVNGVDSARVAMILAVLERRAHIVLSTSDVYVSTVGGIRVVEPGCDLAIALALASAFRQKALPATLAAIGEISLAGEIRAAHSERGRSSEAERLGFTTIIDSTARHIHGALDRAFRLETPPNADESSEIT